MPAYYSYRTPDYTYVFKPTDDPDEVNVSSKQRAAITDFLATVQLSGTADDAPIPEITRDKDRYSVTVSRASLYVYLEFEVRYYMFVKPPTTDTKE